MPFSDLLYQALFDASPNPYLVLDRQLHIVAANRAYLASTGRTLADIAGRWAWEAFPTDPVTQQQSVASFERVIAAGAPDTMALLRFDIPGADGVETRYWSITHTPVFDASGAVAYVIQHPIDVTEIERRRLAAGRAATRAEDHHPMLMEQTGLFNRARAMFEQNQHLQADLGRLQRLFQHAPGFMAVLRGPEHVYESVNDAVIDLMGNRGFVGKAVAQAAPELAAQGFCSILDNVYRTGMPFVAQSAPVTFTLAHGSTSLRYLDFIYQPIVEADGQVHGIFVQGSDVTARVQAMQEVDEKVLRLERAESQLAYQLALADSLRGLRTVAEITAAASSVLGRQLGVQRVLFADVDAANAVTVQRDWCAAGWPSIAGASLTLDDFGAGVARDLRAGRTVRVDDVASDALTRSTVAAHDAIAVRAHMTLPLMRGGVLRAVLTLHCGQPHHWTTPELHMAQDTVERTWSAIQAASAREALLAAADTLRFTHESARLGDWELNLATGATRTSLRHDECFGYTAPFGNWQYTDFMAHLHEDDRARVDAEFQAAVAQHTIWQTECRVVWPDGQLHWIAIFGSVHLVDGVADKIAGIIFDITARKHAEEEMRLEARRKDEFLAMLAHELRNPLAPIAAAAGILSLGRSDAEQVKKTSAVITRQVNHISSLINDLLDVSRVTRGLVALERIPVDIKAAVADAIEQVRPLVEARRHRLEVHLAADHALVAGDKKRLVQVLSNLLNNAAKYTPEQGRIVLSMMVAADEVVLNVSDNGIGMTDEVLGSVFGLFTQAERTADRSQGGLGIGLALVKSLVELHQGAVTVTSAGLGHGSTFSIHLPRLEREAPSPVPAVQEALQEATHDTAPAPAPRRILVVDDNVDAAQLLAMFLEANGFGVAVEHDAARALALAERTAPDVCLLDIGLPGMDGNELARRLRQLPHMAGATLVAITGYGRQQDRETAFAAGFDHHFVKPVAFHDLLAVLATLAPGT